MTDVASAFRAAAQCLWYPINRSEIDEGFGWAEAAMAALPPDLAAQVEQAILCNDTDERVQALEDLADELERKERPVPSFSVETKDDACPSFPTRKRQRKPSIRTLIKQAEKAGKPVSSVTTPDGVTLHFGKTGQATDLNPWDEVLPREPN
jgi:hypothetical protein